MRNHSFHDNHSFDHSSESDLPPSIRASENYSQFVSARMDSEVVTEVFVLIEKVLNFSTHYNQSFDSSQTTILNMIDFLHLQDLHPIFTLLLQHVV
jgi:hypothetical protein